MARTIGFASGIAPELSPPDMVEAAAAGGFDAVGLRVEPGQWTAATTREVRDRLSGSGMPLLDIEVIWLRPGADDPAHFHALDIGAELGARNALVVASDPDLAAVAAKFGRLCEHGAAIGIRVCLEFGLFTTVHRISDARAIVEMAGSPAAGLLVDPLHLHRSGGTPAEVAAIPPDMLPYAQFCDATANLPRLDDIASIRDEALNLRVLPGQGALPLAQVLAALPPGLPLSVELRSAELRERYPDAVQRARVVAEATRAFLEDCGNA